LVDPLNLCVLGRWHDYLQSLRMGLQVQFHLQEALDYQYHGSKH
jgi:hypothetical protein